MTEMRPAGLHRPRHMNPVPLTLRRLDAPARLRARGLHLLCRVGVRARARARPASAHQPGGALARGPRATARGDGLAGADARVELRAVDGHRSRGLAEQASGAAAGDDPRGGATQDPVHQRHPGGHRRERAGAPGLTGSARGAARGVRPHPGGDPAELRSASALLRARARAHRRRGRARVLAHGRGRWPPRVAAARMGVRGRHR